jgi:beta-glucosidase
VPARSFQHWDDGHWHTEPGTFTLHIGHSSRDLPLTVTIDLLPPTALT